MFISVKENTARNTITKKTAEGFLIAQPIFIRSVYRMLKRLGVRFVGGRIKFYLIDINHLMEYILFLITETHKG
jgi:hypothetical protein